MTKAAPLCYNGGMKEKQLLCGKIINTHGVKGVVKAESYCDSPKVLASLQRILLQDKEGNFVMRRVLSASVAKGFVLLRLEGVETMEDAILLKEKQLFALREDIPLQKGAYFLADIIGLPVIDADTGVCYGEVIKVDTMPSSDMYTVKTPDGKEVLFPAVKEFLVKVDVESGVYIRPIKGFFY